MKNITNTAVITASKTNLNELRREAEITQMKGAPFMMASVILWTMITIIRILPLTLYMMNLLTFCCPVFLVPLTLLFSKIIGADSFKKSDNPVNKLGILCTCNQVLYLLIVMWAFSKNPEVMMMLYGMIFGAHLMPFAWVYESKTYLVMSIIVTLGSLLTACVFGNIVMGVFLVICQIITSVSLLAECRKLSASKTPAVEL